MVCSFLSGLMIVDMKYITIRAFPALRYINPANLISDAFYTLYYYDTLDKVFLSIGLQLLMALLFFVTIAMIVRRQRYASL
jgi:ABC-2 type transport system permease protein